MNIILWCVTKKSANGDLIFVRCKAEEVSEIPSVNARLDWAVHKRGAAYVFLDLCCKEWSTNEEIEECPPIALMRSALDKIGIKI